MQTLQTFAHLGYDLTCTVTAVDGGKIAPIVVARGSAWPHRPRTLHSRPNAFDTEAEAFAAAHAQGIAWVMTYG